MTENSYVKALCPVCSARIMDVSRDSKVNMETAEKTSYVNWKPHATIKCLRCKQLIAFRIEQ